VHHHAGRATDRDVILAYTPLKRFGSSRLNCRTGARGMASGTMGNSAWGHGYHTGFGDGAKRGGVLGSLVTLGAGAVIAGGVWVVGRLRERGAEDIAVLDADDEASTASRQDEWDEKSTDDD